MLQTATDSIHGITLKDIMMFKTAAMLQ